jgi:NADH:ubiquinone oxidoreductase subunit 3 (subunit A)
MKKGVLVSDFFPVYIYFGLVGIVVLVVLGFIVSLSLFFPSNKKSAVKFMPYESGIQTQTHLLQERIPLRHYLVALLFLVFDIEIIFLYPWAVVAKSIGSFAFYEIVFFLVTLLVGLAYVWRKGGLDPQ